MKNMAQSPEFIRIFKTTKTTCAYDLYVVKLFVIHMIFSLKMISEMIIEVTNRLFLSFVLNRLEESDLFLQFYNFSFPFQRVDFYHR